MLDVILSVFQWEITGPDWLKLRRTLELLGLYGDPVRQSDYQVVNDERAFWKMNAGKHPGDSVFKACYALDVVFSDLEKTFNCQPARNKAIIEKFDGQIRSYSACGATDNPNETCSLLELITLNGINVPMKYIEGGFRYFGSMLKMSAWLLSQIWKMGIVKVGMSALPEKCKLFKIPASCMYSMVIIWIITQPLDHESSMRKLSCSFPVILGPMTPSCSFTE